MSRKLKNKERKNVQLISNYDPRSPIVEQYRLIRNNLHFSSVDKDIKSIVVTSPEPSDGKSTTIANLAIVLAQQGKQVILVDTDLRKPSIHYQFKVSNREGLTNVLAKEISLKEALTKTQIPNLEILTCGPIPPNPSELLSSKAMEFVMEELNEAYDYVLFDTPPLLVVTDPQTVASKCDGVVMVVSSGKTKRDLAVRAMAILDKANTQLLGVIVNGVEPKKGHYYGHYYSND